MVEFEDFGEFLAAEGGIDDGDTDGTVGFHVGPFVVVEFTGFEEDGIGDADLADIVEEGGDFEDIELANGHEAAAETDAHFGHALAVHGGIGVSVHEGGVERDDGVVGDGVIIDHGQVLEGLGFLLVFLFEHIDFGGPELRSIATGMFGGIEGLIGLFEHALHGGGLEGAMGYADADGDGVGIGEFALDGGANLFGEGHPFLGGAIFDEDAEFFTAVTADGSAFGGDIVENADDFFEDGVTGGVSMFIVELLEMVDIHHHGEHPVFGLFTGIPEGLHLFVERASVEGTGEGIAESEFLESFVLESNLFFAGLEFREGADEVFALFFEGGDIFKTNEGASETFLGVEDGCRVDDEAAFSVFGEGEGDFDPFGAGVIAEDDIPGGRGGFFEFPCQFGEMGSDEFGGIFAEGAGEGFVGEHDFAKDVDDDDTAGDGIEGIADAARYGGAWVEDRENFAEEHEEGQEVDDHGEEADAEGS